MYPPYSTAPATTPRLGEWIDSHPSTHREARQSYVRPDQLYYNQVPVLAGIPQLQTREVTSAAPYESPVHTSSQRRSSQESMQGGYHPSLTTYDTEASENPHTYQPRTQPQRRPSNRDEFDGPAQYLDRLANADIEPTEDDLPPLPIHLYAHEQDHILSRVNERLSRCAFDFVARYSFPIPLEADKRPVEVPGDREWSEWVYLLKRLATKRRIPARVLYNGQIRQFVTILENSSEMRHAAMHQSRPLKDDRNILQLISSGIQVGRIVKDADCVRYLDAIYVQTEHLIQSRQMH